MFNSNALTLRFQGRELGPQSVGSGHSSYITRDQSVYLNDEGGIPHRSAFLELKTFFDARHKATLDSFVQLDPAEDTEAKNSLSQRVLSLIWERVGEWNQVQADFMNMDKLTTAEALQDYVATTMQAPPVPGEPPSDIEAPGRTFYAPQYSDTDMEHFRDLSVPLEPGDEVKTHRVMRSNSVALTDKEGVNLDGAYRKLLKQVEETRTVAGTWYSNLYDCLSQTTSQHFKQTDTMQLPAIQQGFNIAYTALDPWIRSIVRWTREQKDKLYWDFSNPDILKTQAEVDAYVQAFPKLPEVMAWPEPQKKN